MFTSKRGKLKVLTLQKSTIFDFYFFRVLAFMAGQICFKKGNIDLD